MTAKKLEMSLDELIAASKTVERSSSKRRAFERAPLGDWRGGRRALPYGRNRGDKRREFSVRDSPRRNSQRISPSNSPRKANKGVTLRVMGLDYAVLESELMELFSAVGEVTKCWIHYDRTDRSLGTGGVTFAKAEAAEEARRRYDGRVLDGKTLRLSYV